MLTCSSASPSSSTASSTHRLRLPHKLAIIAVGLIALAIPLGVGLTHVHAASVIVTAEEQAAAMAAQHLEFDVASVKFNGNSVTQNNPAPDQRRP